MGQVHDSHPTRAVLREHARPSWTSLSIGRTIPLRSVVSFFSGKQARESHRLRMRSHVASIKCTVLRHHLSFCGRSNPNPITSSRLLLAISPTGILRLKPHWEGSSRTTPLFELEPVTMVPCLNPLSWNRLRICTLSVLFLW